MLHNNMDSSLTSATAKSYNPNHYNNTNTNTNAMSASDDDDDDDHEHHGQGYMLDGEWIQDIITTDSLYQKSFIKDYPKLKECIETLPSDPRSHTITIQAIFIKYQSQPELLDRHLQEICDLITKHIKDNIQERDNDLINHADHVNNCCFELIYVLCNVRGYKTVVRYLPHEVTDLEPVLEYLLCIDHELLHMWYAKYVLCIWLSIIIRVPFDLKTIDSYGGMYDKIINVAKKFLANAGKARDGAAVLISRLFSRPDFETQKMRDFFAWAIAILNAQDSDDNENAENTQPKPTIFLVTGIMRTLAEIFKHSHRDALLPNADMLLETSAKIGKSTQSRVLRKLNTKLVQRIGLVYLKPVVATWRYQKSRHILLSKQNTNSNTDTNANTNADNTNSVEVEDDTKMTDSSNANANDEQTADNNHAVVAANADTAELQKETEIFSDFAVPEQIENILHQMLCALKHKETVVRWSAAKGVGRIVMRLPKTLGDEVVTNVLELLHPTEDHKAWHGGCLCLAELARRGLLLPSRLPDVMGKLQQAMIYDIFQGQTSKGDQVRDAACYVAWAFARAYEPAIMKPFVQRLGCALLTMALFDREIHCRRAACAAFQENVGRQGNFPHGIEINTTADYWSIGLLSNAYLNVSKSIARFDEYKQHMIDHLVQCKLVYWEYKIRHLAGRALHELTDLHPVYMRDEVLPVLIYRCESPSVFERHGGLCGVSNIVRRLRELADDGDGNNGESCEFSPELQSLLRNIIPKLEKKRGYRGKGGERIRQECCEVIACLCDIRMTLSAKAIDRYQQTVDDNLRIPQEFVQASALKALTAMSKYYYTEYDQQRCEAITLKWCRELCRETIASVTRGYARGLGVLSKHLILTDLKVVIDSLIRKSLITAREETRDYDTRKMCCIALADLMENIGCSDEYEYTWDVSEDDDRKDEADDGADDELRALGLIDVTAIKHDRNKNYLPIENEHFAYVFDVSNANHSSVLYDRIVNALLQRFEDYEVDRRGDVGSFVRQFCLRQIYRVLVVLCKAGAKNKSKSNESNAADVVIPDADIAVADSADADVEIANNSESNANADENENKNENKNSGDNSADSAWLRPELPTIVLNCVLRQLSEKLDRVRRSAGTVIELLFDSKDADVQGIRFAEDAQIRAIFANHSGIDWSNPHIVFPILVNGLNIGAYRRTIFEGMLQSLGCINSSMSECALESLAPYLSRLEEDCNTENKNVEAQQQLMLLAEDIIYCCKKRQHNPLFMIPFLKSIGILLSDTTYFEPLQKTEYSFATKLQKQLKRECFQSRDIGKLMTSVKVFIGLALFPQTRNVALQRLMIYLGYQYPALRKHTAAQLYAAVVTYGAQICDPEKCDMVMEFFENANWIGIELDEIREQRNKMFKMLDIKSPKLKASPSKSIK